MKIKMMMLVAACAVAASVSTSAAAQDYSYTYAGTGAALGNTAGSFTINNSNGGIFTLIAFSGTIAGVSYTFADVGIRTAGGRPYLGGLAGGISQAVPRTNDFYQNGEITLGEAAFTDSFHYTTTAADGYFDAPAAFTLVPASAQSPVPEPATWAMMMLGFGGMGYAMRRKSKVEARVKYV